MEVRTAELVFSIPYARSLKEKRQVARSLMGAAKHRFNASIAEVGTQDVHQTLTLGIAVVSGEGAHAQAMLEEIVRVLETSTDAELTEVFYG